MEESEYSTSNSRARPLNSSIRRRRTTRTICAAISATKYNVAKLVGFFLCLLKKNNLETFKGRVFGHVSGKDVSPRSTP